MKLADMPSSLGGEGLG